MDYTFSETAAPAFELPPQESGSTGVFTVDIENSPALDPIILDQRAKKYDFALAEQSPGKEALAQALQSGSEKYLRMKLVTDENIRLARMKQMLAEDIYRARAGDVSSQDKQVIQSLTKEDFDSLPANPESIVEKLYADRVASLIHDDENSPYTQFLKSDPEKADELVAAQSRVMATQEVVKRRIEDVKGRWANAGFFSTVSNYVELAVPFFTLYNQRNAVKGGDGSSLWPGENLEEQIRYLYSIPSDQAARELDAGLTKLEASNPLDAMDFLQSVLQYSRSDKFFRNTMGVVDVATVLPYGTIAKGITGAYRGTASMVKDAIQIGAKPTTKAVELIEATGDARKVAGEYHATTLARASEQAARQGQQATWDDFLGKLAPIHNPEAVLVGGNLSKSPAFLARTTAALEEQSAKLIDGVLLEPITISRFEPGTPAFQAAIDDAIYRVSVTSPGLKDNVMYARPGAQEETLSGVVPVFVRFGRYGGRPHRTEQEANWWLNYRKLSDAQVVPEGNGFAIEVRTVANEADPAFRRALVTTQEATPNSILNWLATPVRSANDQVSSDLVKDRTIAAYGISKMTDLARTTIGDVKKGMSKSSWNDFETFVKLQRDYINPDTQLRGKFSATLGDFEQDWMTRFKRLPTEREAEAYFRYVQISNMDLAIRSLANHKAKASLGIEMVQFPFRLEVAGPFKPGISKVEMKMTDLKFEGRIVRNDPLDSPDSFKAVVWHGENPEMIRASYIRDSKRIRGGTQAFKEMTNREGLIPVQLTDEGYEMLRAQPELRRAIGDLDIDYIYMKTPKTSPLPINQVPDRPGGHVVYKDGFYLSQPKLKSRTSAGVEYNWYQGDLNLAHFVREADAKEMHGLFEQGRVLLKEAQDNVPKGRGAPPADYATLKAHLENKMGNLYSVEQFVKLFDKREGVFDVNKSFSIRPTGRTIHDVENLSTKYPNFRVGEGDPHSVSSMRQDPAFLQERGKPVPSIAWSGSTDKPVLEFAPAQLVDPMETLEGAFNGIIKARYLDDLRIKVTERFINEFSDILDVPIDQLRANPWAHMLDPKWKKGADTATLAAAKNLRRTMLEFLNIRTPLEKQINYLQSKLADSLYSTLGKDGYKKVEAGKEWLDNFTLGFTKDPLKFMRAFAFHSKLGLLNPKQLFLQGQNVVNVVALEGPKRGWNASMTYPLIRGLMINSSEEIVNHYAKMSTKFGWKPDHFKESWEAGNRTGFFKVGGEFVDLGDASPAIVRSKFGTALDQATFFFREGERISRITAWNASYLRWREANPTKILKDSDVSTILARADLLNGNMSRASTAMWQHGPVSIPTQFWSYQARLADLMFGKRITNEERFRLIVGQSLMYGIPTGVAVTGAGVFWPFQEQATKYLVENGMAYDESKLQQVLHEGIGGMAMSALFGGRTNFSETYSPQGLNWFKDLFFNPDKGLVDFMLGASGTAVADTLKSTVPFFMAAYKSVFSADEGYKLTTRDFTDVLGNITGFSNAAKALHAYHYQEYWSKREQMVLSPREVSAVQAGFQAFMGLQPYEISQAYAMATSLKERKSAQKEIWDEAVKNLRLAYKATSVSEADKYFRRAQIHIESGQFTIKERKQILSQSSKGYENLMDSISTKYSKTSPERLQDLLRKGN